MQSEKCPISLGENAVCRRGAEARYSLSLLSSLQSHSVPATKNWGVGSELQRREDQRLNLRPIFACLLLKNIHWLFATFCHEVIRRKAFQQQDRLPPYGPPVSNTERIS